MKEETMSLMRNTIAAAMLGALALGTHAHAAADPCKLEISGNDLMQYDKSELSAPATCKEITVTLHHTGKLPKEAMGHNWVLVSAADLVDVANAGMTAGLPNRSEEYTSELQSRRDLVCRLLLEKKKQITIHYHRRYRYY